MKELLPRLNAAQALCTSHVLLYHSTYSCVPDALQEGLHNVPPDQLYRQIRWLKQHFDAVFVDDLIEHERAGQFAVTFDDAYQSVFDEALPVLEALGVPCTIFINGCSLAGEPFWRDKVRFLINTGRVDDFLSSFEKIAPAATDSLRGNFYKKSKHPSVNSSRVDVAMNRYFEEQGISLRQAAHCIDREEKLVHSPLISYGNHTFHHYVLSSLSPRQQREEIERNQRMLVTLGVKRSAVFSIPFGRGRDFDEATMRIIRKCGYKGFLYSRNRVNFPFLENRKQSSLQSLLKAERYMAAADYSTFQKHVLKLGVRSGLQAFRLT